MEKTKIAIILTAVIALATVTVGVALAHDLGENSRSEGIIGSTNRAEDDDWWTSMSDHMGESWTDIEDEAWFDDMRTYMDEHLAEIENQEWFDDISEHKEENENGNHLDFSNGGCH